MSDQFWDISFILILIFLFFGGASAQGITGIDNHEAIVEDRTLKVDFDLDKDAFREEYEGEMKLYFGANDEENPRSIDWSGSYDEKELGDLSPTNSFEKDLDDVGYELESADGQDQNVWEPGQYYHEIQFVTSSEDNLFEVDSFTVGEDDLEPESSESDDQSDDGTDNGGDQTDGGKSDKAEKETDSSPDISFNSNKGMLTQIYLTDVTAGQAAALAAVPKSKVEEAPESGRISQIVSEAREEAKNNGWNSGVEEQKGNFDDAVASGAIEGETAESVLSDDYYLTPNTNMIVSKDTPNRDPITEEASSQYETHSLEDDCYRDFLYRPPPHSTYSISTGDRYQSSSERPYQCPGWVSEELNSIDRLPKDISSVESSLFCSEKFSAENCETAVDSECEGRGGKVCRQLLSEIDIGGDTPIWQSYCNAHYNEEGESLNFVEKKKCISECYGSSGLNGDQSTSAPRDTALKCTEIVKSFCDTEYTSYNIPEETEEEEEEEGVLGSLVEFLNRVIGSLFAGLNDAEIGSGDGEQLRNLIRENIEEDPRDLALSEDGAYKVRTAVEASDIGGFSEDVDSPENMVENQIWILAREKEDDSLKAIEEEKDIEVEIEYIIENSEDTLDSSGIFDRISPEEESTPLTFNEREVKMEDVETEADLRQQVENVLNERPVYGDIQGIEDIKAELKKMGQNPEEIDIEENIGKDPLTFNGRSVDTEQIEDKEELKSLVEQAAAETDLGEVKDTIRSVEEIKQVIVEDWEGIRGYVEASEDVTMAIHNYIETERGVDVKGQDVEAAINSLNGPAIGGMEEEVIRIRRQKKDVVKAIGKPNTCDVVIGGLDE